jgi:hypothetical protein
MLSAVFGEAIVDTPVSGMGPAENVRAYLPTPEYLEVLGVRALLGRTLTSSDETNQAGVTPAVLSYRFWKRSFEGNLEAHQPELLRASKPDSADWAIQSARLVLQYAQLQAREKSRDEREMDNFRALDPMRGYLRDSFGSSLINFGFSFNEGSFRAMEQGKGLREFRVGPLPPKSLDRMLADVGYAEMAIDLRQPPKQGPVAAWLRQPHTSRSIGAVYADSNAASYIINVPAQEMDDGILFVSRTSATRGNR